MSEYLFGAGVLWGMSTQDAFGNVLATGVQQKMNFGALQDVTLDLSFDTKMLYGSNQFPLAIGRGKGKVSGKAKFAKINGLIFNALFFGQTLNRTGISDVFPTTGFAIPATPFNITVGTAAGSATNIQVPQTGNCVAIIAVRDANNNPMIQVASGPTTGQYEIVSITGGIATLLFAAADTASLVFIDYQYTWTVATGQASDYPASSTVANVLMGYAPVFQADLYIPYLGKQLTLSLPQCISTKLSIATKLDDFSMPEFDFEAFANAAGSVITYAMNE